MKARCLLFDLIVDRLAAIVHVVAKVRGDEVVSGHRVVGQVGCQLGEGPHVADALGGIGILIGGYIIKVNKRVVLHRIFAGVRKGTNGPGDIFLIGLPGDIRVLQKRHQVLRSVLRVHAGRIVVENPKVGACFQP